MKNKLGVIEISRHLSHGDIKLMQDIWKCVTPLFSRYNNERFQSPIENFICYCDKFEEVEEGIMIPDYMLTLKQDENNELIEFEVAKKGKNGLCQKSIKEEQV